MVGDAGEVGGGLANSDVISADVSIESRVGRRELEVTADSGPPNPTIHPIRIVKRACGIATRTTDVVLHDAFPRIVDLREERTETRERIPNPRRQLFLSHFRE